MVTPITPCCLHIQARSATVCVLFSTSMEMSWKRDHRYERLTSPPQTTQDTSNLLTTPNISTISPTPSSKMTNPPTHHQNHGSRLIIHLIDHIAHTTPSRPFCLIPASENIITECFKTITYSNLANAINRVAWYIRENFDRDGDTEAGTLGYIGPFDLRYTIVTFAAQKAGFKVSDKHFLNSM